MEARIFQSTEVDDGHLNVVAYIYIYIYRANEGVLREEEGCGRFLVTIDVEMVELRTAGYGKATHRLFP